MSGGGGGGNLPLQELQRRVIRANLELTPDDRLKVVARLEQAARTQQTRVVLLAVVKFEDGEVQIVSDMAAFVASFERVHHVSGPRQIASDDFSIAMLGKGEAAYQQSMRLTDFLTATHQGWYMTVQDAVATYRKPRNFWKRLANALESYDKRYADYRVVVDLRKTAEICKFALIAHERSLLFGTVSRRARSTSDTVADASSGLFQSQSYAAVLAAAADVSERSVRDRVGADDVAHNADSSESSASSAGDGDDGRATTPSNATAKKKKTKEKKKDKKEKKKNASAVDTLGTSAPELMSEIRDLRRSRSLAASLSSSSSARPKAAVAPTVFVLPRHGRRQSNSSESVSKSLKTDPPVKK